MNRISGLVEIRRLLGSDTSVPVKTAFWVTCPAGAVLAATYRNPDFSNTSNITSGLAVTRQLDDSLPVWNSLLMTADELRALVRVQSSGNLTAVNDHRITLEDALVAPRMISVIARQVKNGRVQDENLTVWLVGQESRTDGYKIVLRGDGSQFGLASNGFPHDKFPVLAGWYGDLLTTFLGM